MRQNLAGSDALGACCAIVLNTHVYAWVYIPEPPAQVIALIEISGSVRVFAQNVSMRSCPKARSTRLRLSTIACNHTFVRG